MVSGADILVVPTVISHEGLTVGVPDGRRVFTYTYEAALLSGNSGWVNAQSIEASGGVFIRADEVRRELR